MNVRLKSYLILLVTFAVGISAGFLGARALIFSTVKEAFRMGPPGHPGHGFHPGESGPPRLEKHILSIAQPTEGQKQKLSPIINKYQASLNAVMEEHRARSHALLDSMDKELAAVLDAGQMEKLRARRRHPPGMDDDQDGMRHHSWGGRRRPSDENDPPSGDPDREKTSPPDRLGDH